MSSFIRGMFTVLSRLRSGAIDLSNTRYERLVDDINRRHDDFSPLPDEELRQRAAAIRQRVRNGTPLDDVLIDTFALVREAAKRTVGMRPYDVQLMAAIAIHDRKMVEMQTGEGKTLAAVLPACLRAFLGRGVHVLTYNDYLAARDAAWMGPIYRFLGLTVGHVEQGMPSAE